MAPDEAEIRTDDIHLLWRLVLSIVNAFVDFVAYTFVYLRVLSPL